MKITTQKLVAFVVATTLACWLLTFFVKARPDIGEFVSPRHELPNYTAQYPGDTKLSDRIMKSYDLAMIIVQSPYMQKNLNALECIRRYAREKFAEHPDFLHPAVLPVAEANHDTVFGAFGYNLFSAAHAYLQQAGACFIRWRVADFNQTYAYQTFKTAYFDLFGWDAEAAVLLARYQNDRAKLAIDVLIWSTAWAAFAISSAIYLFRSRKKDFFNAVRRVTAATWIILALAYFLQAWDTERASSLASMLFAAIMAGYLCYPVAVVQHEEVGRKLTRIRLTPNWASLAAWLTVSFLAIQLLTWIKHSAPGAFDPFTMMCGAFTGNFVHDQVQAKRIVTMITAGVWLALSYWTWRQQAKTYEPELDVESRFNELDAVAPLARIR